MSRNFGKRSPAMRHAPRGLSVTPGEVVVGAGSQPLLSLLCGLAGKNRVAIDERGFAQAETDIP